MKMCNAQGQRALVVRRVARGTRTRFHVWAGAAALVAPLAAPGAAAAQTQQPPLALEPVVTSGLDRPLFVTAAPGDNSRLFIVEQGPDNGTAANIRVFDLNTRTLSPTPFLTVNNITADGNEQGLLGLVFHPDYANNGRFFVNVTAPGGAFNTGVTQIREYHTSPGSPNTADPAPVQTLLSFDQPQRNHNGGWLGFSPRPGDAGNLYIATGDGGGADDDDAGHNPTIGNGQDRTTPLGKMLRINVDRDDFGADPDRNYGIPANNPFAGATDGSRPEIFNTGLRNPFRASFDRATGDLFIGDVGQGAREEIDLQPASNPGGGENFGWRVREGTIAGPHPDDPVPPGTVFTEPIHDYGRETGATVIGGYVYRGSDIAGLQGAYVFGDFISGRIFTLTRDESGGVVVTDRSTETGSMVPLAFGLTSFGEDAAGELYVIDRDGAIYQIVPEPAGGLAALLCLGGLAARRVRRSAAGRA